MCNYYARCEFCGADKMECEEMGDGSPLCSGFVCNVINCERSECITYEEELDIYYPDL